MNNGQKNMLSKLDKVPTQVPDDAFFDTLKINVINKINAEPKIVPFYRKTWIQAAASVLLLLGIGTFYLVNSKETPIQNREKVDFSSLSKKDILNYIEENQEDFESDELADALTDVPSIVTEKKNTVTTTSPSRKDQKNKSVKSIELQKMWNDIDDEEILHYLEEDNYDFDDDLISSI